MNTYTSLLIMFLFNLAITGIIVRFIYFPSRRNQDYVFTMLGFNAVTFLVSSLLSGAELSVGFGFGLFAIFSILRYRTDPIPIREMTYLFIIMALPVVNAVLVGQEQWVALLLVNPSLVLMLYAAEKGWGFQYQARQSITFEKIELIKPENRQQLLQDLCERTGLTITRLEIGKLDFLKDTADITVYYSQPCVDWDFPAIQSDQASTPAKQLQPEFKSNGFSSKGYRV